MFLPELCLKLMVNLYHSHVVMNKAALAFTNLKPVLLGNNYLCSSKLKLMDFLWTAEE